MAKKPTSPKALEGAEAAPAPKRTAKKKVAKLATKLKENLLSKIAPSSRKEESAPDPEETPANESLPQEVPASDSQTAVEPPVQAAPAQEAATETMPKRSTRKAPARKPPARPVEAMAPALDAEPSIVKDATAVAEVATALSAQEAASPSPVETHVIGQRHVTFTHDEIALRAYFIAQERHAKGLPGDAHSDWLEAERQIRDESREGSNHD